MADLSNWQAQMAMGIAAFGRKDYAEAEHAFRAAVLVAGAPGQGNTQLPRTLDHLGTTLQKLGRNDEARTQFGRMIQAQEEALGPGHLDVATSWGRLAFLEASMGDVASAFDHHTRALRIREAQLGPLHPAVALSLNNLGYIHTLRMERPDAEALWMRALAIREAASGPQHPDTAESLENLATLYREMTRYEDAEEMITRALGILQRFPRDPRLHRALAMAAQLAQLKQEPEKLKSLEHLAIQIRDAARRETQADRDAANAVSDYLELEAGTVDLPEGAMRLVLYRGGHVFLESRRASAVRAWTARAFSPETFDRIAGALGAGAFERTVIPMPVAGETPRRLSLRSSRAEASARLPARNAELTGEARAIAETLDGIVRTVSSGKLSPQAQESQEKLAGIRPVRTS